MITIKIAKTKDEILQVISLRRKVLVTEKKYSINENEPDQYDLVSKIYIAKDGNKVIGTARIKKENHLYRIQRMAIDKTYRHKGIGSKILNKILLDFKDKRIYLISPKNTLTFYEKFGFKKTKIKQKGKYFDYYKLKNF